MIDLITMFVTSRAKTNKEGMVSHVAVATGTVLPPRGDTWAGEPVQRKPRTGI